MVWNMAEQIIVETRRGFWDSTIGRRGKPATGNDHSVISLIDGRRARDKSSLRIDGYCLGWVVKSRIEQNHVRPLRMVRNDDVVTDAIIDGQLLLELP